MMRLSIVTPTYDASSPDQWSARWLDGDQPFSVLWVYLGLANRGYGCRLNGVRRFCSSISDDAEPSGAPTKGRIGLPEAGKNLLGDDDQEWTRNSMQNHMMPMASQDELDPARRAMTNFAEDTLVSNMMNNTRCR